MVRHLDAVPAVAFNIRDYKRGAGTYIWVEDSAVFFANPYHGLKHRGVTDTVGNHGDKQDEAGHQSPTTTGRFDHDLPVVKPPRRR